MADAVVDDMIRLKPDPTRDSPASDFAEDVRRDLSLTPKRLQPKYLYDDLGSSLFAAICRLPWYRVARAEKRLLVEHAADVASIVRGPLHIIELGCGTGEKLRVVTQALAGRPTGVTAGKVGSFTTRRPVAGSEREKSDIFRCDPIRVHLVDVSALALAEAAAAVRHLGVNVVCHREAYEIGLVHASADRRPGEHALVLFLGSNIGNSHPADAVDFLSAIRRALAPGDHLLLGVDLVKPEHELLLAYDDPLGLTAAFDKNLLVRINRELDADFALETFDHRAIWNASRSRVEMHLVSRIAQTVTIRAAACEVTFEAGESIWTESSYKYDPEQVITMARVAGFDCDRLWIEEEGRFGSAMLQVT